MSAPGDHKSPPILELLLFLAGMVLFASFIHQEGLLFFIAISGLLFMGASIIIVIFRSDSVLAVFGLKIYDRRLPAWMFAGLATGLAATAAYRIYAGWPLLPGTLTYVVILSPLIGITEELIFRGYLQGRTRSFGPYLSIIVAAAAHSVYKFTVMKSLGPDIGFDFARLVIFTFIFGLIAGYLRKSSRNVLPAVLGHAIFDILVYGDFTQMPVWVWG